jgi:hypothetical protein
MTITSAETRKTYQTILGRLQKAFNSKDLGFLQYAVEVLHHIRTMPSARGKPLAQSSIKTYLSAIIAILRDADLPIPELYKEAFAEYATEQKKQEESQIKTESQESKWMDWETIQSSVDKIPANTKKHLIASLYTKIPPARLDYTPMKWVKRIPADQSINYIRETKQGFTFVINQYKTKETYGTNAYKASPELNAILRAWRDAHPTDEYLLMSGDSPMTPNALSQAIRDIFLEYTGTPVTLNILRHSFASYMRRDELPYAEKKHIAKLMGHSTLQAELYRKL